MYYGTCIATTTTAFSTTTVSTTIPTTATEVPISSSTTTKVTIQNETYQDTHSFTHNGTVIINSIMTQSIGDILSEFTGFQVSHENNHTLDSSEEKIKNMKLQMELEKERFESKMKMQYMRKEFNRKLEHIKLMDSLLSKLEQL